MTSKRIMLFSAALLSGLFIAQPALAAPPDWAPAHGYRAKQKQHYDYVYYPAEQVYYAPSNGTWFWIDGGHWQFGANLPAFYPDFRQIQGVPVVLNTSRPYVQHVYVEEQYGRPWREKHKYKHKDKHKDKHYRKHEDKHEHRRSHRHHGDDHD